MDADTGEKAVRAGPELELLTGGSIGRPGDLRVVRKMPRPKVKIHANPPHARRDSGWQLPTEPDDLTKIRRIKAPLAEKLRRIGVLYFEQIAGWTDSDVRSLSAALNLGERIYQENWIEQAAKLALRRNPAASLGPQTHRGGALPMPAAAPHKQVAPGSNGAAVEQRSTVGSGLRYQNVADLVASVAARIRSGLAAGSSEAGTPQAKPAATTPQMARIAVADFKVRERAPGPTLVDRVRPPEPNSVADHVQSASGSIALQLPGVLAHFPRRPGDPEPVVNLAADFSPDLDREAPELAGLVPTTDQLLDGRQDLTLIDNLPMRVALRLEELGVTRFSEIAVFSADDVAALSIDCGLGDRITEECWAEQAAVLADGGLTKSAKLRQSRRDVTLAPSPGPALVADDGLRRELDARARSKREELAKALALAEEAEARATAEAEADAKAKDAARAEAESQARAEAEAKAASAASMLPADPATQSPTADTAQTHARSIVSELPKPRPRQHCDLEDLASKSRSQQNGAPVSQQAIVPPPRRPGSKSPVRPPNGHEVSRHLIEQSMQTEAEVELKPRPVSSRLFQADETLGNAALGPRASTSTARDTPVKSNGSLNARLGDGSNARDIDAEDYAAYHRDIEEASVEIVPRRHGPKGPTALPDGTAPIAADAPPKGSVGRFLKALRGH
ncbi:MAG: hypothetical protein RIC14_01555 [Filomicrobium sp.]